MFLLSHNEKIAVFQQLTNKKTRKLETGMKQTRRKKYGKPDILHVLWLYCTSADIAHEVDCTWLWCCVIQSDGCGEERRNHVVLSAYVYKIRMPSGYYRGIIHAGNVTSSCIFYFSTAEKVTLSMDNLTHLSRINFHPATASVHSGAALQVELVLQCLMPMPVCIQQLAASIHFALEQVATNGRSKAAQRQTGAGTVEFHQRSSSAGPPSYSPYISLELEEIHDRSPTDNSLNSTGVVCKNTHLVIRRHESSSPPNTPSILSPAAVTMKEGAQMLQVNDVTLQPGNNSIMFTAPVSEYVLKGKKISGIFLII